MIVKRENGFGQIKVPHKLDNVIEAAIKRGKKDIKMNKNNLALNKVIINYNPITMDEMT